MNNINLLLLQATGGGSGSGLFLSLAPWLLIFAIFYLLIIRPQQKRQKQAQVAREELLNALKPGDKVVTSGGIFGTIVSVRENTIKLNIAQSVSIEIQRSAITAPQSSESKETDQAK